MEITGMIHAHSRYSYDGKLSLFELKTLAREYGLQFVCMTEHTDTLTNGKADEFVKECEKHSDDTFRFIPGFEVPFRDTHILMVGMKEFFGTYAKSLHALRTWTSRAPFVVLAHPVRNRFIVDDDLLTEIDALEVWNQQYEGKQVPRSRSLSLFSELRKKKPELVAIGGVDFHRGEHMGGPRVTLNVTQLTEVQILEKFSVGAFRVHSPYASFYGVLPNPDALQKVYAWRSLFSIGVIVVGKRINKILAIFGFKFPSWLTHLVRRSL